MPARENKMTHPKLTGEDLMAYADGEADAALSSRIEAAIVRDPVIAAKVEEFRQSRTLVRQTIMRIAPEPVPDALRAAIQKQLVEHDELPTGPDNGVQFSRRKAALANWASWPMGIAASLALLAVGLGGYSVGRNENSGTGLAQLAAGEVMPARINTLLNTESSGNERAITGGRFRIIASFRVEDGSLCREFEFDTSSGDAVTALACRESANDWRTRIAVSIRQDQAGYAPASSLAALESYINAIGAGEALSLAAEKAALNEPN